MPVIELPYGNSILPIDMPDDRLGEILDPRSVQPAPDPAAAIRRALADPIGAPPLKNLVKPGSRIAVVIDDITRETPTKLMLPPVLEDLLAAGASRENISIVIALGTHRPMTDNEIKQKIDPDTIRSFPIVNVPAGDKNRMVYLGRSSQGIPAWVNQTVAEADLRLGLGMIQPHLDAGYGGGAKIILPGVCGEETVTAFHIKMAGIEGNQLGLVDAPLRNDLEEFVGERIDLDFILNAILDRDGALYQCVAGHFIRAHRAGIRFAREVYGVPVSQRYPVVIANAYPHQIDLWQSTKALAGGEIMTEDGGVIILVAHCPEGTEPHPLFAEYIGREPDELLADIERGALEDPVAAAEAMAVCRMKQRFRIGLVSAGLAPADADRMGFTYYETIETAVEQELGKSEEKKVGLLTHGGVILPMPPTQS